MAKKNKLAKIKSLECLNCGYPFFGNEIYCPECGQKNQDDALSFKNFMNEVFQGFTSWDAKFWKTIVPLLTKPGKVSKEYIEGKRAKYTNPFRFYITTSILFFLIMGVSQNIQKINEFTTISEKVKKKNNTEKVTPQQLDSIKNVVENNKYIPKEAKKLIAEEIEKSTKDTVKQKNKRFNFTIAKGSLLDKFKIFNSQNPNLPIDQALDSLGYENNFKNRFLYDRGIAVNRIGRDKDSFNKFVKDTTSYAASSLFVLLPIFTCFLSFLYIRKKKYPYVANLIFVFHTQTVFFLLLSLWFLLSICGLNVNIGIIILLFLIYLFLAMKRFYNQGRFKTFVKFIAANIVYFFLAVLGVVTITFFSVAFY